jgi:NAD(P)H-flavin reductase
MVMLYSNKTKDDILAREYLEKLREINSDNFRLYHTLTRHQDEKDGEWDGLRGRISA